MKIKDSPTWEHHVRTWGTDFRYEDFIPIFMKESRKWKPEEWAALFEETGARYVVFTTKHADGYALWPTAVKHPHLKVDHLAAGARLCGELTRAVRAQGMKMGILLLRRHGLELRAGCRANHRGTFFAPSRRRERGICPGVFCDGLHMSPVLNLDVIAARACMGAGWFAATRRFVGSSFWPPLRTSLIVCHLAARPIASGCRPKTALY